MCAEGGRKVGVERNCVERSEDSSVRQAFVSASDALERTCGVVGCLCVS
jgi:hypothetical protein